MEHLCLAAEGDSSFWPTGAIMIIVITAITGSIWMWREHKLKKDK